MSGLLRGPTGVWGVTSPSGGRGFTFTIEFLGDGAREANLVRRNRLATADLDDLTYDTWWCLVRFRSRLITAELAGSNAKSAGMPAALSGSG